MAASTATTIGGRDLYWILRKYGSSATHCKRRQPHPIFDISDRGGDRPIATLSWDAATGDWTACVWEEPFGCGLEATRTFSTPHAACRFIATGEVN